MDRDNLTPKEFAEAMEKHQARYRSRCWDSLLESEQDYYYDYYFDLTEHILRCLGYGDGLDIWAQDPEGPPVQHQADHVLREAGVRETLDPHSQK